MAVPFVSMDLFALATLPTRADEAKGTATYNFYALRDNLRLQNRSLFAYLTTVTQTSIHSQPTPALA
jgi:hypothetical protein